MESSSSLLPRHTFNTSATAATDPQRPGSSRKNQRRRRPPPTRSKPPSQDRLVVVFVTASAIFSLISISPFLFGDFPSYGEVELEWIHKHGDGKGGVLNLAGNKTLLAWHYFMGQKEQQLLDYKETISQSGQSKNRENENPLPLARGVSGLPLAKTPALVGAQHGSIHCPSPEGNNKSKIRMDKLAYWNEPQGESDVSFVSPFAPSQQSKEKRYVTFEPDRGGWNNVRMSLEIVIVFASATGRTLVLPPDTPFYLLNKVNEGQKSRHHGFADFLDLDNEAFRKKVNIISMKEFLELEGRNAGESKTDEKMFTIPGRTEGKKIRKSAEQCYYVAKSDRPCDTIYDFLRSEAYVPELQAGRDCLIFDVDKQPSKADYTDTEIFDLMPETEQQKVKQFCDKRNPIFFGNELASAPLIHFHAGEKHHRLLNHFYTFLYFTETKVDHHFKRFVRDFLHYTDTIWCAAGRVLEVLEEESTNLAGTSNPGFSSMHVRRGDFQYKKVKITADDWYNNTKDIINPSEIVYIATDEKNKTFFEPLAKHYSLRFLSDFLDAADLNGLDPNLMGMIDTIVASQGRVFVGTWFSTFTGYINRLRGYYGMSGTTSYYSQPERKFNTHKWEIPHKVMTAREWPTAWVGIDGDHIVASEERAL